MASEWSKKTFARNLSYYMEISGKSQKELAEIAGVTAPTFNEWIKAKKFPRIDRIQALADYFGILKSDLIGEKMTEKKEKDNDIMSDIIVRMRMDDKFRTLVSRLYTDNEFRSLVLRMQALDSAKINSVREMLDAFAK